MPLASQRYAVASHHGMADLWFSGENSLTYIIDGYINLRYRGLPMHPPPPPSHDDLQEMLPLSPATFFVLFSLADGEKHGYRIMQEVKVLSDGKLRMGPATLYTTIQTLADQSLIEELESDSKDRRRSYRLTRAGKQLLNAEFSRQNEVLLLAKAKKVFPVRGKV
jgi:DNA-binding PadR family transcriptional regulator